MMMIAFTLRQGGYISEYDEFIAGKVARILSGGDIDPGTLVQEDYILDLERENFMSLLGEAKTQERIQHLLETGKQLRN
jgi:3-hydroxyacyl-CoA dehydrogenase